MKINLLKKFQFMRIALLLSFALSFSFFNLLHGQTASETQGCAPLFVTFTPPTGLSTYFWDFDNGGTSVLENASTTFTEAGTYDVSFSESQGGPIIGTITITVFETPILSFEADTTIGCAPFLVNFTNNSIIPDGLDIIAYNWTFGDGGSVEEESPAHTYQEGGVYDVSLQIISNLESCNLTIFESNLIDVSDGPNTMFTTNPSPPSACVPPLNVTINNTTDSDLSVTYEWDFGNGNTFAGINPPAQNYDSDGNFPISLTATDENGCAVTFTQNVSIGEPLANFTIPDTVCLDELVTITNLSDNGFYNWNFGATSSPSASTTSSPSVRFRTPGPQDVSLSVTTTDGSCTGDTTITIFVDDPDPSFVSDPNYSCSDPFDINFEATSPDAVAWDWIFYNDSIAQGPTSMVTYINPDSTIYSKNGRIEIPTTLVVTNPSGCRDTLIRFDTIYQPNALYMPDVIDGCAPLTVTFADSSDSREEIILWEFDYGDGTMDTFTNDDDHTHTYTEPGVYETVLNIQNEAGCVDTSYVLLIEVGGPIDVSFNGPGPLEICPGDTVTLESMVNPDDLEGVDAYHFETDNGRSFHCFQEDSLSWIFDTETGAMDVSLTVEYNGCQTVITEEDYITVNGPIARIDYLIECESPYDVMFRDSSYDATSVSWDFGDMTTSMNNDETHTYLERGDYTVILTAENAGSGCPASKDTALVCIREVIADIELDTILCRGQEYQLIAGGSQDVHADCWKGYEWDFEISGRPITTQDDTIPFNFPTSGDEIIQLVVEDINGCTDTTTLDATVYGVDASFIQSDTSICLNGTVPVDFMDTSVGDTTIVTWSWSFGSDEQNPSNIFTGDFMDTIRFTLVASDVFECPGTVEGFVTVYQPFSAIIAEPFPANICIGEEVDFLATDFTGGGSFLNFEWDFGNETVATGSPVMATYNETGTYNVLMTFTEDVSGCSGQRTTVVNVQEPPTIDFTFDGENDPIICGPAQINFFGNVESEFPVTYNWNASNGQTGMTEDVELAFDLGTFDIDFIVSTIPSGCADTITKQITLVGPQGDFELSDEVICDGDIITFTLVDTSDISSYIWDFGDGAIEENITPIDHQYIVDASGLRTVVLTIRGADGACESAISKTIDITKVVADFTSESGDFEICVNSEVNLVNTSVDANEFDWDFGNDETSSIGNPTIVYDAEGVYTVSLLATDTESGCNDETMRDIFVNSTPIFGYEVDTICKRDTFLLEIDEDIIDLTPEELMGYTFQWNVISPSSTMISDDTLATPEVVAVTDEDIELSVTITDPTGCTGDILVTVPVFPLTECIDVAVPNVFTPNGDSRNDSFNYVTNGIPEDGDVTVIELKIFNRWGQLVYDNNDPLNGWDGQYNGNPAPSDVYVYKMLLLIGTETRNITFESKGDVSLLR